MSLWSVWRGFGNCSSFRISYRRSTERITEIPNPPCGGFFIGVRLNPGSLDLWTSRRRCCGSGPAHRCEQMSTSPMEAENLNYSVGDAKEFSPLRCHDDADVLALDFGRLPRISRGKWYVHGSRRLAHQRSCERRTRPLLRDRTGDGLRESSERRRHVSRARQEAPHSPTSDRARVRDSVTLRRWPPRADRSRGRRPTRELR